MIVRGSGQRFVTPPLQGPKLRPAPPRRCPVADDYKVGDVPITWHVSLKDERVTRITFVAGSVNFEELLGALVSKFGKPAISRSAVTQNAFGAKFDNRTAIWKRGGNQILAMQRFTNLNTSAVIFSTPDAVKQDALDELRRESKAASGL
jgi:hypothetical protein